MSAVSVGIDGRVYLKVDLEIMNYEKLVGRSRDSSPGLQAQYANRFTAYK